MGRPKGGKNRKWTMEEKADVVRRYLGSGMGRHKFALQAGISDRLLFEWTKRYMESGEKGLENKRPSGNRFSALHTSKSLSEVEKLRLVVAKQKVEIARLKNGYRVEGSGANKEFVTLSGVNIKSSKK
ncbi:transposase [Christensenella timonensis]|uniref:transposase n=1 Tax=Christensenella timonensis TaxID=1816678 RepID=UPI00093D2ACF|nr:transposase [Christensenella timonensis]